MMVPEENKISFTVNNIPFKRNTTMDGMVALKKIQHFSYALSDEIGLGYSSHVYKGKNDKTNQLVAIKVIDIKKQDELHRQFTNNEISILQKIKNIIPEHLLKLQGVFKTKNNLYIITEFCEGKDLAKILRKKKKFNEDEAQGIMKQFLKGFGQLFGLKVVHRDLKLANIFIRKGKAILADLGFAIEAEKCIDKFDYNVGSPFYMPPESLKFNRYSHKSDIWAIGVIAFELVYGHRPWKDKDDGLLYQNILNTSIEELFDQSIHVSEFYKQFIRDCLQIDFEKRATPEYVINYQWPLALDYIDGYDNYNQFYRPKPMSIAKITQRSSISPTNLTSKNIRFDEVRQNKIFKNQPKEIPVSLMQRNNSPSRQNFERRKRNINSSEQLKQSSSQFESFINKRSRKVNTMNYFPTFFYSESDVQKAILSQIQFCRFLNLVFDEIKLLELDYLRDLSYQISKKIIEKTEFLSNLQFQRENEVIPGIRKYMTGQRWEFMNQLIKDYKEKYEIKFSTVPYRQAPRLSTETIRDAINKIKNRLQQYQRLVDVVLYLYQVLNLQQNSDLIRFAKESRIEYLAENKNLNNQADHTQRLIKKLEYLDFL